MGVSTTLLAMLGVFYDASILASLILSLCVSYLFTTRLNKNTKQQSVSILPYNIAVILFVSLWTIFNLNFTTETPYIYKDPGIYSTTGHHLKDENGLKVMVDGAYFGDNSNIQTDGAGLESFSSDVERKYIQAPHMFHSLLGAAGRLLGENVINRFNIIIGSIALLSFYSFSLLLLKPKYSLLATLILSLSLPFLYFSRDTYTEPLTLLISFSAMGILSYLGKKPERSKWYIWCISGVQIGSLALVRVDGYLIISALIFAGIVFQLNKKVSIKSARINTSALIAGMLLMVTIGLLDLHLYSRVYFTNLRSEIYAQIILMIIGIVVSTTIVLLYKQKKLPKRLVIKIKNKLPRILSSITLLSLIIITTRPLWYEARRVFFNNAYIESIQLRNNYDVIDGTKYYAELTHLWPVWYFGIILCLLAVMGLFFVYNKNYLYKNRAVLPLLTTFIALSTLYINFPRITPDQIWASRRFLPIIFPSLIILSLIALSKIYSKYSKYEMARPFLLVGIFFLTLGTLTPSLNFLLHKENAGRNEELSSICNSLPKNASLLIAGTNGTNMLFSIMTKCDVVVGTIYSPTREDLRKFYDSSTRQGKQPFMILVGYEYDVLPKGSKVTIVSSRNYSEIEKTLGEPPNKVLSYDRTIFGSKITSSGQLIRLNEIEE